MNNLIFWIGSSMENAVIFGVLLFLGGFLILCLVFVAENLKVRVGMICGMFGVGLMVLALPTMNWTMDRAQTLTCDHQETVRVTAMTKPVKDRQLIVLANGERLTVDPGDFNKVPRLANKAHPAGSEQRQVIFTKPSPTLSAQNQKRAQDPDQNLWVEGPKLEVIKYVATKG